MTLGQFLVIAFLALLMIAPPLVYVVITIRGARRHHFPAALRREGLEEGVYLGFAKLMTRRGGHFDACEVGVGRARASVLIFTTDGATLYHLPCADLKVSPSPWPRLPALTMLEWPGGKGQDALHLSLKRPDLLLADWDDVCEGHELTRVE